MLFAGGFFFTCAGIIAEKLSFLAVIFIFYLFFIYFYLFFLEIDDIVNLKKNFINILWGDFYGRLG